VAVAPIEARPIALAVHLSEALAANLADPEEDEYARPLVIRGSDRVQTLVATLHPHR